MFSISEGYKFPVAEMSCKMFVSSILSIKGCISIWPCEPETGIAVEIVSEKPLPPSVKHVESPDMNVGDDGTPISLDQDEAGERLNDGTNGVVGSVFIGIELFRKAIL